MASIDDNGRITLPSGRCVEPNFDSVQLRAQQQRFADWPIPAFHPTLSRLLDVDDFDPCQSPAGSFTGYSVADVLEHRCDWSTRDQLAFAEWIRFHEDELAAATANRLDDWSGSSRFLEYAPSSIFVSPLKRAVRGLRLERASAAQWRRSLTNLPGIKRDELDWSGTIDRLVDDDLIVSRSQILEWMCGTRTRLVLGLETRVEFDPAFEFESAVGTVAMRVPGQRRRKPYAIGAVKARNRTLGYKIAFAEFTDLLNLGSNWFAVNERNEIVPVSPTSLAGSDYTAAERTARNDVTRRFQGYGRDVPNPQWRPYVLPGGDTYREWLLVMPDFLMGHASDHFTTPNVVVHLRTTVRPDLAGSRMLFVEELQSDWHERGRREGYGYGTAVFPAPFAKEWPILGLKCALYIAAMEQLDGVALAPGVLQLERYPAAPIGLAHFYDAILPKDLHRLVQLHGCQVEETYAKVAAGAYFLVRKELRWFVAGRDQQIVSPSFQSEALAWRWLNRQARTRAVSFPFVRLSDTIREQLLTHGIPRYGGLLIDKNRC